MKIFISVSDRDRQRHSQIEDLVLALEHEKHEVFLYDRSLLPGESFHKKIRDKINQSDMVLFFVTPHSIDPKRYTRTELEFIRDKWKHPENRVLPIQLEPVDMKAVPAYLRQVTFCKPVGDLAAFVARDVAEMERRLKHAKGTSGGGRQTETAQPRWFEGALVGVGLGALAILVSLMLEDLGHLGDWLASVHGLIMVALVWIAAAYFGLRDPAAYAALAAAILAAFLVGMGLMSVIPREQLPYVTPVLASMAVPAVAAMAIPAFRQPQQWLGFAAIGLLVVAARALKIPQDVQRSLWEAMIVGLTTFVLSTSAFTPGRQLSDEGSRN